MYTNKNIIYTKLLKAKPQKQNVSIFLRSQDYFLYNLLNRHGRQEQFRPFIRLVSSNVNDLPKVHVNKIIRKKSKDGYYSFEKIELSPTTKKLKIKESDSDIFNPCINQSTFSKYDIAYEKRKAKLYRINSCRLIKNCLSKDNNFKVKNPLIITHLDTIHKKEQIELKQISPKERIYSSKNRVSQRKIILINNKNINKINNDNKNIVCNNNTKNEGTQITNHFIGRNQKKIEKKYISRTSKSIKLLIHQQKRPFSSTLKQIG